MKKFRVPLPLEHCEQVALFQWADLFVRNYPELSLMFAIPNGGLRNVVVAKKLQAEGVKPGVPDVFLPVARGGFHGLFIEMKRIRGGAVSKEQYCWGDALAVQGYQTHICKGWQEAANAIEAYLKLEAHREA